MFLIKWVESDLGVICLVLKLKKEYILSLGGGIYLWFIIMIDNK